MRRFLSVCSLAACIFPFSICCRAQAQSDLLDAMRVEVSPRSSLKVGARVQAITVDDYFVSDALVVPRGTAVLGRVTRVAPVPRRARLAAMTRGDFTPLKVPQVQFSELRLRDGRSLALLADPATQGSATVRFYARGTRRPSVLRQAWATLVGRKNAAIKAVKAPGKKDRIEDFLYSQLPWHPQEVEEGTVYEIHLRQPPALTPAPRMQPSTEKVVQQSAQLRARLVTPLDSAKAKDGDAVEAVVIAPEFDVNHKVEIPQGSLLFGRVVKTRAARRFGRNGALRFTFEKLQFPEGFEQPIVGVAKGVDSRQGRELAIDTEGGVEPSSNKSVLAPLALGLLSASALTEDEAQLGHAATSSNGFGLIGRAIAIGTKSNIFGGVVGGIATARMVYTRFLEHGKDVRFDRGTGIEVDLGPSHRPMTPSAVQH